MRGKGAVLVAIAATVSAQQISTGCNTYLAQLDSDSTLSQCATPILEATASFNPVSATGDASNTTVQATLATICSSATQFCSFTLLQTTLNQFYTSCSAEMAGSTAVPAVQSLYDSLYMLPAFKTAVCATDADTQKSCLLEIGNGSSSDGDSSDTSSASGVQSAVVSAPSDAALVADGGNATVSMSARDSTSSMGPANVTNNAIGVVALQMLSSSTSFDIQAVAGAVLNTPSLLYQAASSVKQLARRRLQRRQEYDSNGQVIPSSTQASASPTATGTTDAASLIESAIVPNTTTFTDSYLHFLFLNPDMTTEQLCTSCTQQILASYVSWEGRQPYPIGISNSGMLGVQIKLYRAVSARCGAGFAQHISVIAGQKTLEGSASSLKIGSATIALSLLTYFLL